MPSRLPRPRILERGPGDAVVAASVLPGGLRVVTETVPDSRSASVGIWVGVGSADEQPRLAGASHYLEHVLFKGTATRSAAEISATIDARGGELNAFTAHEYTCYYAHVLAEEAATAIDLLGDVVLRARVSAADVEVERSVIVDEIAMRDDDPIDTVSETLAARLFNGHPVGRPVSGTADSVRGLTRRQIHGYYRRRYDPRTMVVAVAGGVEHRDVVRWVRDVFASALPPGGSARPLRDGPELAPTGPGVSVVGREMEQAHLAVGVPALARGHADRYALAVLSAALGGGMSSRLFRRIREDHGLAYSCYSGAASYAGTGSWTVYASCHPENLPAVAGLIEAELTAVAAEGLGEDERALAQGQLCGGMVLGLQDSEARMNRLGRRALTRRGHLTLDDELAAIRAVTADEVTAVARRLLARPLTAAVVGPYAARGEIPDAVTQLTRTPVWQAGE